MRAASHVAINGRESCPAANGSSKVSATSPIAGRIGNGSPLTAATIAIKLGVIAMPMIPESEASNTAAGTLPRAMLVIATDEEIVDDKAHRKNTPSRTS
mgnify:CR=1 FL=1